MRMLMNNLDAEVAERPQDLIIYGGTGKAARSWECYHAIVNSLKELANDETLLVQSGKPVGVFRTHEWAPRVLIANANLVGHWSNWEKFHELERLGLIMYGQMTAGSWIYIGTQGILQGTYETFAAAGRKHFGTDDLSGKLVVTGGMGGMGGAQPLAATLNGAAFLGVEVDEERIKRRIRTGYCDYCVNDLDEALRILKIAVRQKQPQSVGLVGNCAEIIPELARRGVVPLDGTALRRLDRVTAIVIDSAVLCAPRARILSAATDDGDPAAGALSWQAVEHILAGRTLSGFSGPGPWARGGWRLVRAAGPAASTGPQARTGPRAGIAGPAGLPLDLFDERGRHRGSFLIGCELDLRAEALLGAARACADQVILTEHASTASLAPWADEMLPAARSLAGQIRGLQGPGHGGLDGGGPKREGGTLGFGGGGMVKRGSCRAGGLLPRHCQHVAVQQTHAQKFADHEADAARGLKGVHIRIAVRIDARQERRDGRDVDVTATGDHRGRRDRTRCPAARHAAPLGPERPVRRGPAERAVRRGAQRPALPGFVGEIHESAEPVSGLRPGEWRSTARLGIARGARRMQLIDAR